MILLTMLVLIFAAGCSPQSKERGLKTGKYIMQDAEVEDWSWVKLKEDNEFEFNRCGALSYLPKETYSVEDNVLILSVNENEEYKFMIDGNNLIFISGKMAEPFVEEGAVYKLSDKE